MNLWKLVQVVARSVRHDDWCTEVQSGIRHSLCVQLVAYGGQGRWCGQRGVAQPGIWSARVGGGKWGKCEG